MWNGAWQETRAALGSVDTPTHTHAFAFCTPNFLGICSAVLPCSREFRRPPTLCRDPDWRKMMGWGVSGKRKENRGWQRGREGKEKVTVCVYVRVRECVLRLH